MLGSGKRRKFTVFAVSLQIAWLRGHHLGGYRWVQGIFEIGPRLLAVVLVDIHAAQIAIRGAPGKAVNGPGILLGLSGLEFVNHGGGLQEWMAQCKRFTRFRQALLQVASGQRRQFRDRQSQPLEPMARKTDLRTGICTVAFDRQHGSFPKFVVEDFLTPNEPLKSCT